MDSFILRFITKYYGDVCFNKNDLPPLAFLCSIFVDIYHIESPWDGP